MTKWIRSVARKINQEKGDSIMKMFVYPGILLARDGSEDSLTKNTDVEDTHFELK